MKYIIILFLMITGCSSGGGSDTETTVVIQTEPMQCRSAFYGDSIGKQMADSIYAPDFDYYVKNGRMITDVDSLDDSYCTIYLELGTNMDWDNPERQAIDEMHLISLIAGIEDKVICVLPMTMWGNEPYMRGMMKEHCAHVIDPLQAGVYPLNYDEIHLSNDLETGNIEHYSSLFQ